VSPPKGVGFSYCDIGAAEKCVDDPGFHCEKTVCAIDESQAAEAA
jgi:hypothetical protein